MTFLCCQNCMWSGKQRITSSNPLMVTSTEILVCRRRAPNPGFPAVGNQDWCGDFKALTRSSPLGEFIAAMRQRPAPVHATAA